ncbi:hypothetical protein LDENG_00139470 [Lucifuga dentata]|nr:hypothetical protein LDENG_00139470 [Lucifuga dentata]
MVAPISWEVEEKVKSALEDQPGLSTCPSDRLFVPSLLRPEVLQWAHASRLSCHPGIQRTISVLRRRFWWSTLEEDTREFVNACPVCCQHKPSHAPEGLLQPLPVPHHPWSHISLDLVTGLPPSEGNIVILMIVDWFSKMAHFVPLPKLPSTKEAAGTHVFHIHGFQVDVVSDRGPQFSSVFWREFCTLVGATVSLSSGFHLQSNGQSERMNQEMEMALHCMVSQNPPSLSSQLLWVEYTYNTLPNSATGMSPFQYIHGFQPPLFSVEEKEITCPSVQSFIHCCCWTWSQARATLLHASGRYSAAANRQCSEAPTYLVGQKVWLSTKDLSLWVECPRNWLLSSSVHLRSRRSSIPQPFD